MLLKINIFNILVKNLMMNICIIYYTFFYSIKNLRLYSNCKLLLDW